MSSWTLARCPSRWTLQVAALAVALVVLLLVAGLLLNHDQWVSRDTQRRAAIDAAQSVALELSTIDAANAAQHMDALLKQSTGEFHDQVGGYAAIFRGVLQAGNVTSRSHVTSAGIEHQDGSTATVLVTVSATVTNSQLPAGQQRDYRLAVRLQNDGDRWLASKVDYVG
ncbi:MAG TPA: hypothetical protein VGP04_21330 [Pseudonocardiaceae bacterium]|nr:hypothetical protein [Pseudonocardiaceae bacterium]